MDTGIILDLETTGLDSKRDVIIEIGIIKFAVSAGSEPEMVECYSAVQDPGFPLSKEIIEITGLSDAVLSGRQIDWMKVRSLLEESSIVIAHNADFDRSFIEARKELSGIRSHWGCSVKHILWKKKGFATRSLNYLAADHGFLNPFAHRALFDCATTFRLIAPHLTELVTNSYEPEVLVSAVGAAFEKKDALRTHGYKWDAEERVWKKRILNVELTEEVSFLEQKVYEGPSRHQQIFM